MVEIVSELKQGKEKNPKSIRQLADEIRNHSFSALLLPCQFC